MKAFIFVVVVVACGLFAGEAAAKPMTLNTTLDDVKK
jgi:hypothetical protein